jgi:hypothetical protein
MLVTYLTAFATVPDRCSGGQELKKEVPIMDKVLKAEIYELLNEADCSKVLFPSPRAFTVFDPTNLVTVVLTSLCSSAGFVSGDCLFARYVATYVCF